tara:strand:- start:1212 stop:2930 length:1719 start_codon:yes stop_codon:yes gene_type:complete
MTSVVAALDTYTPQQYGENGHLEYGWSNSENEKITQLYFQLTRCTPEHMTQLATQFKTLLNTVVREKNINFVYILYRLVIQTRDLIAGKGEYALTWHLINILDQNSLPVMARKMIYFLVHELPEDILKVDPNASRHPYGSWRDIKYLWSNFKWSKDTSDFMLTLVNNQIRDDMTKIISDNNAEISLVGKWAPREKSQFSAMFKELAKDYFSNYILTAKTAQPYSKDRERRACMKAYGDYRRILSSLNQHLDTTQVKQCDKNYAGINWNNVTSVTMNRQMKAFQNIKPDGTQRSYENDRIVAAKQFTTWLESKMDRDETIKGKRVGVNDMVKQAMKLYYDNNTTSKQILNSQWADGSSGIGDLEHLVAMCDTSGSMESDDALYAAIGLSLRVAEKSKLGRGRVMTFTNTPSWIKLGTGKYDFVENVERIRVGPMGYNTNFTAALTLLLNACVAAQTPAEEVGKLTLVIFSDMQIDYSGNESLSESMWQKIERMFHAKGYYKVPHILFWNLRSTSGFPTLTTQKGASMFSGFSPALLNMFCERGVDGLKEMTPWKMLNETLDHARYRNFEMWGY